MEIDSPKRLSRGAKTLIAFLLVILSPVLIIAIMFYLLWGVILCTLIWLTWRKRFVLFVYSDSPIWKDYIETEIFPHIQDHTIILNWSQRKSWKPSLAVLAFRYFGGYRNFNPIAIVFRPFHLVKTYRFFQAFRAYKHGDPEKVEETKNQLFENLGI